MRDSALDGGDETLGEFTLLAFFIQCAAILVPYEILLSRHPRTIQSDKIDLALATIARRSLYTIFKCGDIDFF